MKDNRSFQNFNLSARQATALRQLARMPWPIERGKEVLQTTLGSLYRRKLIRVSGGCFEISDLGEQALHQQSHAEIARRASSIDSPFARVIAELANWAATPERKAPARLHMVRGRRVKRAA